MNNEAKRDTEVPKRRGGGDGDEHWLENLDLDRTAPAGEPESLGELEDEELEAEVEEELEEEEEDFRG